MCLNVGVAYGKKPRADSLADILRKIPMKCLKKLSLVYISDSDYSACKHVIDALLCNKTDHQTWTWAESQTAFWSLHPLNEKKNEKKTRRNDSYRAYSAIGISEN